MTESKYKNCVVCGDAFIHASSPTCSQNCTEILSETQGEITQPEGETEADKARRAIAGAAPKQGSTPDEYMEAVQHILIAACKLSGVEDKRILMLVGGSLLDLANKALGGNDEDEEES